ncbi:hypothetical protein EWM64_g2679 [Hericium alpestre]|uniref:Uncharacterized protein n=1 Tax=Hericium alpestre TaxID=135208 RepID=A0A4Z0A4E1_9AGAM|nr:hypothetical protein EWM64_g2679 [Hericium alpestre]
MTKLSRLRQKMYDHSVTIHSSSDDPQATTLKRFTSEGQPILATAAGLFCTTITTTTLAVRMMATCTGFDKKDRRCVCSRFMIRDGQKAATQPSVTLPALATSAVDGIINQISGNLTRMKATEAAARQETNLGFRPGAGATVKGSMAVKSGRKGSTRIKSGSIPQNMPAVGPSTSRAVSVTQPRRKEPEMFPFYALCMIPYGLTKSGLLKDKRAPDTEDAEALRRLGLCHMSEGGVPLQYSQEWKMQRINDFVRQLLPNLLNYLDARYGVPKEGESHWRLLKKQQRKLVLIDRTTITGVELTNAKGSSGRNWIGCIIHIVPRYEIPENVYRDWGAAIQQAKIDYQEGKAHVQDVSSEDETDTDLDLGPYASTLPGLQAQLSSMSMISDGETVNAESDGAATDNEDDVNTNAIQNKRGSATRTKSKSISRDKAKRGRGKKAKPDRKGKGKRSRSEARHDNDDSDSAEGEATFIPSSDEEHVKKWQKVTTQRRSARLSAKPTPIIELDSDSDDNRFPLFLTASSPEVEELPSALAQPSSSGSGAIPQTASTITGPSTATSFPSDMLLPGSSTAMPPKPRMLSRTYTRGGFALPSKPLAYPWPK